MKCAYDIKTLHLLNGKIRRAFIVMSALVVALVVGVGCIKREPVDDRVSEVESIAQQNPEEALRIIQNIDRTSLVKNEDEAHYALVYSEVCYYNRMLVDSDSLTLVAVKYYDKNRNHDRRARAFFQHGTVLQLNNRLPEAMVAFMESLNSLNHHPNTHLEGIVHRAMGDVYRARYCFSNSYAEYRTAYECFNELNLPYHCYYTKYNMGQAAERMRNYAEAEELFIEARDYAIATTDRDFLCAVLHELCEIYLKQHEYDKCRETIDIFEDYDCVLWFVSRYYAVRAIVETEAGNHDEALRNVAIAESIEGCDEAIIEEAKYYIYNNLGDTESALHWLECINARLDNSLLTAANQPVLNYQIDLLKSSLEHEEREHKIARQRNISTYVAIAILISLLLGFLRGYAYKKNRDIQQYIETIRELQLTKNDTSDSLSEAVDQLYNDRLNDLNRLCETYYEHSDTSRHAAKVFEQVRQTIESIKCDEARLEELEKLVNSCRGNLMAKLREQCPRLNAKEQRVVLYSYAGFSSRAICTFMETDPVALSKVKYRIKLKIKECGAKDADLLIDSICDR